jgi:hypothetical protein
VVPIQLPIGEERSFRGVVDLVAEKAYIYQTDGSGKFTESACRRTWRCGAGRREALIEMVAEADESLMEKVLRGGHADPGSAGGGPACRHQAGTLFPLALHFVAAEHRHPAAARTPSWLTCLRPRRKAVKDDDRTGVRVRLEDHRRSLRRAHHDVSRDVRHAEGRLDRAQQTRDAAERLGT